MILTACISKMKHSEYGNLMPIPVDKDGNRLATDAFGRALEQDKLVYVYSDADGEIVETAKDSYTGRADPMPDYEVIICNNVLGYAYKYQGAKWVNTYRGITDQDAQELASEYNASTSCIIFAENNRRQSSAWIRKENCHDLQH